MYSLILAVRLQKYFFHYALTSGTLIFSFLGATSSNVRKKASRDKAEAVVAELRAMKLKKAAKKVEDGIEETLTYCDFSSEHWTRIRTNNVIERLNREIRRRTRVVGRSLTATLL